MGRGHVRTLKMRYCIVCKKGMFTSYNSVWIKRKNYDIHKKCELKLINDIYKDGK